MEIIPPKILLVDDDTTLCDLLSEYLGNEGLSVDSVNDGESALARLNNSNRTYDAVVLDIMMPGIGGMELLQQLRPHNTIPVIMLTGRGDDIDRIIGLEMGADDYLGKPCNPRELLARIRAILRRTQVENTETSDSVKLHNIQLRTGSLSAEVNGTNVELTGAEFNLLSLLMHSAGKTLSKSSLTEGALQRKLETYDRSIDVHISRLRQKLSKHGVGHIIKSVRGIGYQMLSEANLDE